MATTIVEDFSSIISNFNSLTGESISKTNWQFTFNKSFGICSNSKIYGNPNVFGNYIEYNNGLKFYGSSNKLTINKSDIYTNPGTSVLKYNGNTDNLKTVTYRINGIASPSNTYYVSYDTFEEVANEFFDEGYNNEETFIGLGDEFVDIGLVILKAPSKMKLKNPSLYVNKIKNLGAIGDSSYPDITEYCDSSLLNESDRIISLVYRKDGKYYSMNGEYSPYAGSDLYNLRYYGSNNISALQLTKMGLDGRMLKGYTFDTSSTSDYLKKKLKASTIYNDLFYPLRENNTTFDSQLISDSNLMTITYHINYNNGKIIFYVSVDVNGYNFTSSAIYSDNLQVVPKVSISDFNNNYSLSIKNIELYFDNSTDIISTNNKILDPVAYYIEKLPDNSYVNSQDFKSNNIEIVLPETSNLFLAIGNFESSGILFNVFDADNNLIYDGSHGNSYLITTPGKYRLTGQAVPLSGSTKLPSNVISYDFTFYKKANNPIITESVQLVSGTTDLYEIVYTITNSNNIDCYFTVDGSEPSDSNGYVSRYNGSYPSFRIDENVTINAMSYEGYYNKSDIVSLTTTDLIKPYTVATPVISSSLTGNVYLITMTLARGDIYYTVDGTTPTNKSIKYSSPFILTPIYGRNVTIKAIGILYGANTSSIATSVITFNHISAPWILEKGSQSINDNTMTIGSNTLVSRLDLDYDEYVMTFNIINLTGNCELLILPREAYNYKNNYNVNNLNQRVFSISNLVSNSSYSLLSLGYVYNMYTRFDYRKYKELIWNRSGSLSVKYTILNKNDIYYQQLKLICGNNSIESEILPIDISKTNPALLLNNIMQDDCNLTIGNITFTCIR